MKDMYTVINDLANIVWKDPSYTFTDKDKENIKNNLYNKKEVDFFAHKIMFKTKCKVAEVLDIYSYKPLEDDKFNESFMEEFCNNSIHAKQFFIKMQELAEIVKHIYD